MDDHVKAQKYRLAIINFDDSPAEPMRVMDFIDLSDIKDYIVLPYLRVTTKELIDEGVDRLYVTGVKQYCPISNPEQEASRITFADRLKFSKFMQETFAENNELRKLVKDLHALASDILPQRKSDYMTICSVEECIEHYSNAMPEIEDRMRGLGIKVS